MTTKADTRVMKLQAKQCQILPATDQTLEEAKDSLLLVSEGERSYGHIDFRLGASRTETVNFCCVKPPNLWPFVTAALGNSHTPQAYRLCLLYLVFTPWFVFNISSSVECLNHLQNMRPADSSSLL